MINLQLQGGLGNQLFEVSVAYYYSKLWNEEITLDISRFVTDKREYRNYELLKFKLPESWKITQSKDSLWKRYGIRFFLHKLLTKTYLNCPGIFDHYKGGGKWGKIFNFMNQKFLGYYCYHVYADFEPLRQSHYKTKHFCGDWLWPEIAEELADELKEIFSLKDGLAESAQYQNIRQQIQQTNSVGVHIRRGDFVSLGLIVCSINYFVHCMKMMEKLIDNPVFFIFSDNIEWVKENINITGNIVFVDSDNSTLEDFTLLMQCKHFIMSNSTFSWWGAFLSKNEDKRIIAPKFWVVHNDYIDPLIRKNMIIINNRDFQ